MSLVSYRERVQDLANKRDGEPIYNGSLVHAEIVVESMFAHAHKQVSILTGSLNPHVYGTANVIEKVDIFLAGTETRIRILIEEDESRIEDHPFFEKLSNHKNDLEVRRVPVDQQGLYDFHFLVMDEDSYRFEEDKEKFSAIAAFGDEEGGKNLMEVFDELWEHSPIVQFSHLAA